MNQTRTVRVVDCLAQLLVHEGLGNLRADIADDFYLRLRVTASGTRHRIAVRAVKFGRELTVERPTFVVSVPPLELSLADRTLTAEVAFVQRKRHFDRNLHQTGHGDSIVHAPKLLQNYCSDTAGLSR